ncbi:MAG: acetate--CoA ligase family protein [Alphaproteobacteria bacterium]
MTSPHRLAPLLTPRSIAIIGASTTPNSVGNTSVRMAKRGDYKGRIFPINPKYAEVEGLPCFPSLAALPEPVDMAVLCVANQRLEETLKDAIANKVRAVTFFSSGYLENDSDPPLSRRLARLAKDAGLPVCGGNCMGFYNLDIELFLSFGWPPYKAKPGNITLLSHSGSSFSSLTLNDERLGYNLCVSTGLEIATTVADYLDYALDLENTRAVGLILETVRDPPAFLRALAKAEARNVPVVALKIGRTEASAKLAISHSGAIAGNDAAYEAVFERYGVHRVEALDELAASLALFAQPRRVTPGGLVGILDSGAERELLIDLAEDARVPLPAMTGATTKTLAGLLDPGLEPVNPLDAWGTGHNWEHIFTECFAALVGDPNAAVGVVFSSLRDGAGVSEGWVRVAIEAARRFDKPIAVVTNFGWTVHPEQTRQLTDARIPLIEGTKCGLVAVRNLLTERNNRALPPIEAPKPVAARVLARWRERLAEPAPLDEAEGLQLLADYGVPTPKFRVVEDGAAALKAAKALGYPVALKTAMPGIAHKSDVGGVKLGLKDAKAVKAAYAELKRTLGKRVIVARMAPPGIEMALGVVVDPQFGPLVLIGAGGVLIELLGDRRMALPNFDAPAARRMIDRLKVRPMLDGLRGMPRGDVASFARAASRLSRLAHDLGDLLAELDVNPVIVGPKGAVAVDALVVTKAQRTGARSKRARR